MPIFMAIASPITDHMENRPPTQSQSISWLSTWIPHSDILSALVEIPIKWRRKIVALLSWLANNHDIAVLALDSVSMVENDFDEIINSVVCGFNTLSKLSSWVPSILETKCTLIGVSVHSFSAVVAITGPRSEPPTPILTTSVIAWPE